ncbi:GNAT family N-acetyltransferase [Desertibacillus haloalkaliphilus]|uniref:GNAT family N-acetyltransferase n=1 Tax=Desertibacillus haloalkaliphilus TaxID=1328930 RepID=UPI001C26A73B|nr:GNAT family N-acetyltransferase [Desertibacillus haloalkaliphilus]MBU8907996.1 GNAT family N-acetyltransferase [Desertibacillus haloalkaliphilus]
MVVELTIREATIEDLPEIVAIYNATIPGRMVTADLEPVSVESRKEWFHQHTPNYRPLWVMETENKICGWLSLESFYGRPAYHATAEVSIYIKDSFTGKGIGSTFLEYAIEQAPTLGIKTILGFVFGHNRPSLQLFYRFGFEKWGELPNVAELDDVERDLVIIGKRIDT